MTAEPLPLVSIVVPVRNEEAFIARCLGAVLGQDYPPDRMEIMVVDGMSDDATIAVIGTLPVASRVRVLRNPGRIQSAGLNLGIQEARGEIIVRVDGHTIIAPDYVRRCVMVLQETGAWNVGGAMDPEGITAMGRAIAAAGKSAFAVPSAFHVSRAAGFTDTVYLGAWPRWVFEKVGLFRTDVGVNEDYEMNVRIRQAGGGVYFSPAIRSTYFGRQTLDALFRQYYRYGQSKVRTLRRHPTSLRPRQIVAPAFVAWTVVGAPLALIAPHVAMLYGATALAYGAASLFFSLRLRSRLGWRDMWRLPIVFATIHAAWGCGFWYRLLRGT
jgi:glycosyltransferase involved in cell wall biosynthesis